MRKQKWSTIDTGRKKITPLLTLLPILLFLSINTAFSQIEVDSKPAGNEPFIEKIVPENTGDGEKKEPNSEKSEFIKKYSPGLGFIGGINIPSGDVASALGMGYGVQVFGDIKLPIKLTRTLQYRARLNTGYYSLPGIGDFSGTFTMIPFMITFEISYPGISGFRPYFGLGAGITYNSISGDSGTEEVPDASSVDGSLSFSLGTGYTVRSMPHIEYNVDINFILAFESVIGQFFTVSAGITYRFQSPRAWLDEREKDKIKKNKP